MIEALVVGFSFPREEGKGPALGWRCTVVSPLSQASLEQVKGRFSTCIRGLHFSTMAPAHYLQLVPFYLRPILNILI